MREVRDVEQAQARRNERARYERGIHARWHVAVVRRIALCAAARATHRAWVAAVLLVLRRLVDLQTEVGHDPRRLLVRDVDDATRADVVRAAVTERRGVVLVELEHVGMTVTR